MAAAERKAGQEVAAARRRADGEVAAAEKNRKAEYDRLMAARQKAPMKEDLRRQPNDKRGSSSETSPPASNLNAEGLLPASIKAAPARRMKVIKASAKEADAVGDDSMGEGTIIDEAPSKPAYVDPPEDDKEKNEIAEIDKERGPMM